MLKVKLYLCLIKHHAMNAYRDKKVWIHTFRTRWMSVVSHFTPGEEACGAQLTEGWVDPRAGQDTLEKREVSCPCWE